ncbi:PEP-CTERM sorting domain-containing protein [Aquisphaera insulae]|uniref:PEP-CTERM sorting domain-containing protein n=1 Tax=Aquisphaera insulae TaxID=2712864 RepID=UPI0013ED769F|nr:PEP-CTERM sorting domain-containing protein [Aquisphaera insulae]
MRRFFERCAMGLLLLLGSVDHASAGSITYNILDFPAYQNGFAVTGTITTDGTIGNLTAGNITSWSVTVSQAGYSETFTSNDSGANVVIEDSLVATPTALYLPPTSSYATQNLLELLSAPQGAHLIDEIHWSNSLTPFYLGSFNFAPTAWNTTPDAFRGANWVIATVPEPSSLALFSVAILAGSVLARRRSQAGPRD